MERYERLELKLSSHGRKMTKALPLSMYRRRLDKLTLDVVCWIPYGDHCSFREFEVISLFSDHLRWGPLATIPPHLVIPSASVEEMDARWMQFGDYIAPMGQICVVPDQCSSDYMEWFYMVSHLFMTSTQSGNPPRTFVELDVPQQPVTTATSDEADVDVHRHGHPDGYVAIADKLERLLNLRILTEGTEAYTVAKECPSIARSYIGQPTIGHRSRRRRRMDGRAIGRLVGKDRHDDHDATDVPERRRPTASACRQRVHQMTADARDLAEDVADMTKDVPDLAEETPEMCADIQGADGAEGSDADDAEGFPGGPHDPSVLTSFADHVAHAVWSGQERPDLKLVSHGRNVTLIGRPVLEIEGLVSATGLSLLIDCSVLTGDPGLISAFVERWHNETSTFHLPVGELTITLDDVSSLLHLPITGALHSFHALSTEEARFLLTE
ncbi:Protein MAIN-LIKE 1 [Glycine max]|nr:Protein MAIN-LIKE 1 [Glycine max]